LAQVAQRVNDPEVLHVLKLMLHASGKRVLRCALSLSNDTSGTLVCACVYCKGAQEVVRRLRSQEPVP